MIVRVGKWIEDVRVAIDMNRRDYGLILEKDADTLELEGIIRSKLPEAVQVVETAAPLQLLETGVSFDGEDITWDNGGKGWIILPDDFMRLVAFRMSDWRRPVYGAITEQDPLYLRQSSMFKGIYGTPSKPVVAVVKRAEGTILEFYSCNDDTATVVQSVYRRVPHIDHDDGLEVSERCYDAAVYQAAAMALMTLGDEQSAQMLELSKSLLV